MANIKPFSTTDSVITLVSSSSSHDGGPEVQPHLHVHEQLIIDSSSVLQKLFRQPSARGVVTRIKASRLELDLPYQGLRILTHWLYHREVEGSLPAGSEEKASTRLISLVHAHHVGEKLHVVDFVDSCTDSILRLLGRTSELSSVVEAMPAITRYTSSDSRLRKLCVCWLVRGEYKSVSGISWHAFTADEAFCQKLLSAFFTRKLEHDIHLHHTGQAHAIAPCAWHWHVELGMPCYMKAAVGSRSGATAADKPREKTPEEVPGDSSGVDQALPTFIEV